MQIKRIKITTSFFMFALLGAFAFPVEIFSLDWAGRYKDYGEFFDIAVSGKYAYVADGGKGLQVLDISNPSQPIFVGNYNTPMNEISNYHDQACGVALSGNYAYVAYGSSGLQVIDITNPASPALVSSLLEELTINWAHYGLSDVVVMDNYAYTIGWSYGPAGVYNTGLFVVDISDSSSPRHVGTYIATDARFQWIAVRGNYAYIGDVGKWGMYPCLRVIDIGTPSAPELVANHDSISFAKGVVSGSYMYEVGSGHGLKILDITNPGSPVMMGICSTAYSANDVAISGNLAYIVGNRGLQVIDISEAATPVLIGTYSTPGSPYKVALLGQWAFVLAAISASRGGSVLQVLDISNPVSPNFAKNCDLPNFTRAVAIAGGYAFVVNTSGLQVLDVSAPHLSPVRVGSCDTPGSAQKVAVSGGYAYVADASKGLQIIDIKEPFAPTLVGSLMVDGGARDVTLSGKYAFVAVEDVETGLSIIDISKPSMPELVGSYTYAVEWGFRFRSVAVAGNYAYLAHGGDVPTLVIIDISDLSTPRMVSHISGIGDSRCGGFSAVAVSNDCVYLAGNGGLHVVDVRNPESPTRIEFYETQGKAVGLCLAGNRAYVADEFNHIPVFDISEPSSIKRVGTLFTNQGAQALAYSNRYVYSAEGYYGLSVIDIGQLASQPIFTSTSTDFSVYTTLVSKNGVSFRVSSNKPGELQLNVHDIFGRNIWNYRHTPSVGVHCVHWNVEQQIHNGLYVVTLQQGNRQISKRFTIVR